MEETVQSQRTHLPSQAFQQGESELAAQLQRPVFNVAPRGRRLTPRGEVGP
jgi:hypothetical protein